MFLNNILIIIPSMFFYIKLFILACSYYVVTSRNPIYSILFLILVFGFTSVLFIFLNIDFLALILVIIYLGAVCVLFLFVMMMLNIKILEIKREINFIPFISVFLAFILFLSFSKIDTSFLLTTILIDLQNNEFGNLEKNNLFLQHIHHTHESFFYFLNLTYPFFVSLDFSFIDYTNFLLNSENNSFIYYQISENQNIWTFDNLKSLGLILYNFFVFQFIISGLVLFIAMVGAIFLTLELHVKSKRQVFFSQISRSKGKFLF